MHNDIARVLIETSDIQKRVAELGAQITGDYRGRDVVAVGILKGSIIFYADLTRHIDLPLTMDFMSISSYGNSRKSSGVVQIRKDLDHNIMGKHVLLIEDILDSGQTLSFLSEVLATREPASIRICTLLDKPVQRVADIQPDYRGFIIPDEFVVGYGLDHAERYRNLSYIGVLKPKVYEQAN